MQPPPPASGRGLRLAAVSLALLALLALVAFASRSGFGHGSDARPSPVYVSYAYTAFLIVFVLAIPVSIYIFWVQAREVEVVRQSFISRTIANILTMIVIAAIVALAVYLKHHHSHFLNVHPKAPRQAGTGLGAQKHKDKPFEPAFEWPVLAAALAILVPLVAFAVYQWRRGKLGRRRSQVAVPSVADDLAASISDAIDDLEREPDARRAVIAAYARMEGVLTRHGVRRRASDTPTEYLRRVLLGLTSDGAAVQRLTGLFEQAKFSQHEIGPAMKGDAISALRTIRADLQAAT